MLVRVIAKCYIDDRVRKPGMVLELKEEHMNKGSNGKLTLPSWAEAVDPNAEENGPEETKPPEPTTLHEIAEKPKAKVSKPATKGK